MRMSRALGILALLIITPLVYAQPAGKLVRETWDAAFLDGQKAGHFHTTVCEVVVNGETVRRVTQELNLSVKRFGQKATINAKTGDEETLDGKKVVGVFMTQGLAVGQQLVLVGRVQGKVLVVTVQQPGLEPFTRKIPWDDNVMTLSSEESLLKDRKAKPGDRISYRLYAPVVNNIVQTNVTVKDWEKVPLNGVVRKLLRVESKPEKIEGIQLPSQTLWFDEQYQLIRSQTELPGFGELTLERTSKAEANKPVGKLRDISEFQSIVLNKTLVSPHEQKAVVYRITMGSAIEDLEKSFSVGDGRQAIKNVNGNSFELHIKAVRKPDPKFKEEKISDEYLKSNFFINSDDKLVKEHAATAVGKETDPWKKSQLIERWVRANMKKLNFENGIATADHVAKHLEGDCTEFAMLAAAMCRAEGIPSRTAIGLVYYTEAGTPKLGYHMWTEVAIKGQWLALDATLALGSVGPVHLKITDHSWHETRSLVPLLPLMRVMGGKPKVEILRVGE